MPIISNCNSKFEALNPAIHSSLHIRGLHIAARSTEFWDAGLEGKEEGAAAE